MLEASAPVMPTMASSALSGVFAPGKAANCTSTAPSYRKLSKKPPSASYSDKSGRYSAASAASGLSIQGIRAADWGGVCVGSTVTSSVGVVFSPLSSASLRSAPPSSFFSSEQPVQPSSASASSSATMRFMPSSSR